MKSSHQERQHLKKRRTHSVSAKTNYLKKLSSLEEDTIFTRSIAKTHRIVYAHRLQAEQRQPISESFTEHVKHLEEVLVRLGRAGLTVNPEKVSYAKSEISFLGHLVSSRVYL
ncbi:hypothetical protein J6590_102046 [Homalodisca vitripennis]|nr:hypothetical protein J6590_102046 [Homalodisca vitripennis]